MKSYLPASTAVFVNSVASFERERFLKLAHDLDLPLTDQKTGYDFLLLMDHGRLALKSLTENFKPVYVEFSTGSMRYRQQHGGGKNQLIAKAVGLKRCSGLTVLDVTAGLGRDAFILAYLGCQVTMVERSRIIGALLNDGLQRWQVEQKQVNLNLSLVIKDATEYLLSLSPECFPDVIYMDPMFPEKANNALVKKEMRVLRALVGDDLDAKFLFSMARRFAKKRVVVKRPRFSSTIHDDQPDWVLSGESSRFDIYT